MDGKRYRIGNAYLFKLQFPTGSLAVGAVCFPTGGSGDARSGVGEGALISLAKSLNIPTYFGGDWNGNMGNDHGVDDIHSTLPRLRQFPKVSSSLVHSPTTNLFLEDSFHSLVRRGTWRHNNGNWYENDVVWTDTRAHRTSSKIKCSHASFSDLVVKQYKIDINSGRGKIEADQCEKNFSKRMRGKLKRHRNDS